MEVAVPRVLVAVADGSEEMETVTIFDTLIRAGLKVTMGKIFPRDEV